MTLLQQNWLPKVSMKRIILHWTAGGHKATTSEKKHYHFLIEDDGTVVRARNIKDNVSTSDKHYAAHTRSLNRQSIGVSVCAMAGAQESHKNSNGNFPMTEKQWDVMAQVTAELCRAYGIAIKRETVLAHGEVQSILGVTQSGKWDPLRLPWAPNLSKAEVGNRFRTRVRHYAATNGVGGTFVSYTVKAGDSLWSIAFENLGAGDRWIEIRDAAQFPLNESDAQSLAVGQTLHLPSGDMGSTRNYIVLASDTLWSIAYNELGSGGRWRELRDHNNKAFDEKQAQGLAAGDVILIPN